jgi:hypothetical protein
MHHAAPEIIIDTATPQKLPIYDGLMMDPTSTQNVATKTPETFRLYGISSFYFSYD